MPKDTKTQSLILTILVVASLIVGYFVTVPFWKKLSTARAELTRAQLDSANLKAAQSALQAFIVKYESLSDQAKLATKALPSEPESAVLLASIEELANAAGVALSSINVIDSAPTGAEPPAFSVIAHDVSIDGSGSYFSFRDFLNRLENHLRIIDLRTIDFSVDDAFNLQFQLQIRTYYQK